MGQKTNPIGFRLGVSRQHRSRYYAGRELPAMLKEDELLRTYLKTRLGHAAIADVVIERRPGKVVVTVHTGRPGVVIGKKGAEVDKLREELEDLIKRKVAPIKVIEIKNPDLNAQLVAEAVAEQLKKRAAFRRVLKQRTESTMSAGAKGVRIKVSGRLGGAEIARSEATTVGSVPLTTLQANVDYGYAVAYTTYGAIGVKTWIYRGMFGDEGLVADRRLGIGVRLDRARGQQILAEQDQHHGADERKAADREEPDDRPLREDRRRRHAAAPPNTTSSQR